MNPLNLSYFSLNIVTICTNGGGHNSVHSSTGMLSGRGQIGSGLPWWLRWVKNMPAVEETWVQSLVPEDPLEKGMATNSSIFPLEIPCSLVGYSPWGHKESDTTE